jgi:hypothetical protein
MHHRWGLEAVPPGKAGSTVKAVDELKDGAGSVSESPSGVPLGTSAEVTPTVASGFVSPRSRTVLCRLDCDTVTLGELSVGTRECDSFKGWAWLEAN